jgi:3-oxoacyl-(acyl-carrier-protein) synthase
VARRIVVTAAGAVTAYGVTARALAEGLAAGRTAFAPLQGRLARCGPGLGAEVAVPRAEWKDWFDPRVLRTATMTRQTTLGCIAMGDVLKQGRVPGDGARHPRHGAFLGSFIVPPDFGKQVKAVSILSHRPEGHETGWVLDDARLAEAMKFASAFDFLRALPNMPSSHLAIQGGFMGPSCTYLGGDASGLQAIGMAACAIEAGEADAMVAGGAFCPFQEVHLLWQQQRGFYAAAGAEVRPFDVRATGGLPGEGAGLLLLEAEEHAAARGVAPIAEFVGFGQRIALPGNEAAVDLRADALRAALPEGSPDWVAPTSLAQPDADTLEAQAYARAFGALPDAAAAAVTPWLGFAGPATAPLSLIAALLGARGAAPARLVLQGDRDRASLAAAFGRSGRTGPGRAVVASSFGRDGVHAAVALRVVD